MAVILNGQQNGTDITTPTAMPAGGVGIRGWLSAIWTKLNGTLAMTGTLTGTFYQATQPVSVASAQIASGAIASGAVASGAVASGAVASGAIVDGADVTQGAKADGVVDVVMDTTGLTLVGILKSIHNRLYTLVHTGVTADTELPAAAALNGTILKSVSTPVVGAALLVSDNTNFIQPLGDAANGLDVDVTRMAALIAGEAHIGEVGGKAIPIIVTPTLTVGATYVANDFVGTNNTAMTFASAARIAAGSGTIIGATLIDYVAASVVAELWLFNAAPAGLGLDSAAFTISDADALLCIGVIPFATYYASALNSISNGQIPNGNLPFKCPAGATSIFGALVTRGSPAYTTGMISVRVVVSQD